MHFKFSRIWTVMSVPEAGVIPWSWLAFWSFSSFDIAACSLLLVRSALTWRQPYHEQFRIVAKHSRRDDSACSRFDLAQHRELQRQSGVVGCQGTDEGGGGESLASSGQCSPQEARDESPRPPSLAVHEGEEYGRFLLPAHLGARATSQSISDRRSQTGGDPCR